MTAPGLPMHLVSAFLLLWTCWETWAPGSLASLYIIFGWVSWMGVWLIRGVLRVAMGLRHPSRASSAQWLHWSIEPLLFASAVVLIYSGVLLHVAFDISRPAMDQLAQQALATPGDSPLPGGRAGLYEVEKVRCFRVDPAKPEVIIYLVGGEGGFEYSPKSYDPLLTDLGGGWYSWVHRWN
jgi:hypothetical protein